MASLKELLKPLAQDGAALSREQAAGECKSRTFRAICNFTSGNENAIKS
jgi:hypothetical protein